MDKPAITIILILMKTDTDVLIVGGGLNGPALALALASGGIRSIVIDAMPKAVRDDPDFDGHSYALSLTSVNMLKALGIWSGIVENTQPMLDIVVTDGKAGEGVSPLHLHFDHREIEEGPMGHMIEDRFLRQALLAALEAESLIEHIAPQLVTGQSVVEGHASVSLVDGRELTARLIVGCDGRKSQTAMRARIQRTRKSYHQTGLVCSISHELPHNGVAHQFFMPSGPLAILPLPGNRSSIVWTETSGRAETIAAMSDEDYLEELRPRFGDFLGELTLTGARFAYPLDLTLAQSFTAERVALAGDAAHGIHYIAGQGLNLGLRDVATLAETLIKAARLGEDIGSSIVLDTYAKWRHVDTSTLVVSTDTINRVFSNDNPLLRLGRDLGMGLVNAIPAARRTLIREAAGLNGDLPRLMQGRAI
ncbi:MAG: FAD-dependent monooxygenase [Paracoccaceae bacterium]